MDLSQAEAVIDLIHATTKKESKSSVLQLEGFLSKEIAKIREILMSIMVEVEVSIDYPEYDVEEVEKEKALEKLNQVKDNLEKLRSSFDNGKIVKEGIKVALIGKPNVGKSSLLNAILKEERAIVTDIEGTTRDTIEEAITIEGIPLHIIDTAGIRKATNEVEKIGIEKSKKIAEQADLIIAILDGSKELNKEDKEMITVLQNNKAVIIINKIDLLEKKITKKEIKVLNEKNTIIEMSIKDNIGLEELYQEIIRLFKLDEIGIDNSGMVTNVRHKNSIQRAIEETNKAIESVSKDLPIDISAIYIKDIMEELGKITGESVSEDIIKEIFAKFCLGK